MSLSGIIKNPPKTWGYYMFENVFKDHHSWPTSRGIKGFGCIILAIINVLWGLFPIIKTMMNYKTCFHKCIFDVQFLLIVISLIGCNSQLLYKKHHLFELIKDSSDFNRFGMPSGVQNMEKFIRPALKFGKYATFTFVFLTTHSVVYDISATSNLILEYYVPFNVKPWQETLIILFETYSFYVVVHKIFCSVLLYCYTFELLITRLKHIESIINNCHFESNERNNIKFVYAIEYYQHTIRLFNSATNFFKYIIVPYRFCNISCTVLSVTGFFLQRDLPNSLIFVACVTLLLLGHNTGQRIINANKAISEAIYNINWYDGNVKIQKDVLHFLIMSQRNLIIGLPLLGSLSHTAITDELKRIYVWCNWMGNISKKKRFSNQ